MTINRGAIDVIIIPNIFFIFTISRYFHQYFPIFLRIPTVFQSAEVRIKRTRRRLGHSCLNAGGLGRASGSTRIGSGFTMGFTMGFRVSNKPWVLTCQILIQVSDMKFLFVCLTTIHFTKCYTFELQQEFGPKAIRWVFLTEFAMAIFERLANNWACLKISFNEEIINQWMIFSIKSISKRWLQPADCQWHLGGLEVARCGPNGWKISHRALQGKSQTDPSFWSNKLIYWLLFNDPSLETLWNFMKLLDQSEPQSLVGHELGMRI